MKIITLALVLSCLEAYASKKTETEQHYDTAVAYLNGDEVEQDDKLALKYLTKAAIQGLPKAQHRLGVMYLTGRGVAQDDAQALRWFKSAAGEGLTESEVMVQFMELANRGNAPIAPAKEFVQEIPDFSADLLEKAEKGDAVAQHGIGLCYLNGKGVEKDEAQALRWIQKSAQQGYVEGQYALGEIYGNRNTPEDGKLAHEWHKKASEQRAADSLYNLGLTYLKGEHVPQDKEEAAKWFKKAADYGHKEANKALLDLK